MKRVTISSRAISSGNLILVNSKFPYRGETAKELLFPIRGDSGGILVERSTFVLFAELMGRIRGWSEIVAVSGWRSVKEQQTIWDHSMAEHGWEFTRKYVAAPGHSEHQTGLAIDLGLKKEDIDFICPEFPNSGICQTFRKQAARYGFVERYPKGKEQITGIAHEPWHFRYVGVPHAAIMSEQKLSLEEYMDFIREFPCGKRSFLYQKEGLFISVSFQKASDGPDTEFGIEESIPYCVSGNNMDGFIITTWRNGYECKKISRRA